MRLIPESTPVARGAADAYLGACLECHGQSGTAMVDDVTLDCAREPGTSTHLRYEGDCSDLLAYFEVVRLKRTFRERAKFSGPNKLLEGERLARRYHCFQCHGELGQGGFRNSGALKGYVPGYFGSDFEALTRGGRAESVRAWIGQGVDAALFECPIEGAVARFFIDNQTVSMPVFGSLPEAEIQVLVDYVIALHEFGKMDARSVRAYSWRTQH